jgi:phenylalanyl-tRNA synthetase alpha chain
MHDTLYVKQPDAEGNKLLLRTHTTVMDNQLIQKYGTPCKFVVPGKVYRHENLDASHDCVFWQIDGVVIDKNITIGHFKSMMRNILEALLEKEVQMRLRPAYFPFVEPGFEIDAWHKVGNHEKWLEILGAGMIHPYVLKEAGVDPAEYSGFAFGMGMTRLVAIKNNISDIRVLTNGDVRFVRSF